MKPSASALLGGAAPQSDRPQQALVRLLDELGSVLLQMSQAA
jgi:hypothetical protein